MNEQLKETFCLQMAIAQALGQQTQGLLQVGTKRLLGKIHTRGSLIESLSSVLPLSSNTAPASSTSPKKAASPTTTQPPSQTDQSPAVSPADSDSIPVIWNNVLLDSTLEDSTEDEQESQASQGGLLSKLTRQVKQMASPEKKREVYKRGVTEYQFDNTAARGATAQPGGTSAAVNMAAGVAMPTTSLPRQRSSDVQGVTAEEDDDDRPPGVITNSNTDSGIDQVPFFFFFLIVCFTS